MHDVELYRHLLGLERPWTVARVEVSVTDQRVDVWAEHGEEVRWPCPECGAEVAVYDHAEERVWRHLDSCQFFTYLHARPPRVRRIEWPESSRWWRGAGLWLQQSGDTAKPWTPTGWTACGSWPMRRKPPSRPLTTRSSGVAHCEAAILAEQLIADTCARRFPPTRGHAGRREDLSRDL